MKTISRKKILKSIGNALHMVMQVSQQKTSHSYENAAKYVHQAEALVELLEVEDCGSVGGFDRGQARTNCIFERWDWLYRKFNDPEAERFGCDIVSYEDIADFFSA